MDYRGERDASLSLVADGVPAPLPGRTVKPFVGADDELPEDGVVCGTAVRVGVREASGVLIGVAAASRTVMTVPWGADTAPRVGDGAVADASVDSI
jgi:hypothetical protein